MEFGGDDMICVTPTRNYPDGRTGTVAGAQAHKNAGEDVCESCREAANARNRHDYAEHQDAYKDRARKIRHNFTRAQYDAMLEAQGGGCAICGDTEPGGNGFVFHVDHDHACCPGRNSCGECVRGLLCAPCNVGLGSFRDNIDKMTAAIAYLMARR